MKAYSGSAPLCRQRVLVSLVLLAMPLLAGCYNENWTWQAPRCDVAQNIELIRTEMFAQGRARYGNLTKYASYDITEINEQHFDWRSGDRQCTVYVQLRVEFPTSLGPLEAALQIDFTSRRDGWRGEVTIEATKVQRL